MIIMYDPLKEIAHCLIRIIAVVGLIQTRDGIYSAVGITCVIRWIAKSLRKKSDLHGAKTHLLEPSPCSLRRLPQETLSG
jgi:hypothetical protein